MRKLNIKNISILIGIILVSIGIGYLIPNKNVDNSNKNETQQREKIEKNIENNDEVKPSDVESVEISIENQIYTVAILDSFENGKNLTVDQYLEVVYNGLCNGYIKIDGIKEKNEISKEQVNNIVYSMFGTELRENKSIEGMKYEDGIYKFSPKRAEYIYMIENTIRDSAAGTSYTEFDLYKEFASGQEQYMGKYTMSTVQNTVTGESYIKSFIKK